MASRLAKGAIYRQPVISLDIFATAAAAVEGSQELETKTGWHQPHSAPQRRDKKSAARHFVLEAGQSCCTAQGRLEDFEKSKARQGEWQLYNLATDISETTDLVAQNPTKREELLAEWNKLNGRMVDPIWVRPDKRLVWRKMQSQKTA